MCGRELNVMKYASPVSKENKEADAKSGSEVNAQQLMNVVEALIQFFTYVVSIKADKNKISSELQVASLSENLISLISQVIVARQSEIEEAVLCGGNGSSVVHPSPFPLLKDFDWSIRVVLSSDSMNSLRIPVMLLHLTLKKDHSNNSNNGITELTLELTKNELDHLLNNCRHIQQVVQKLVT